jgi:glucose-6-phosphate 1-dehydrogenase
LFINNWRWKGVPFYLRSGKNLAEKQSQIIIQFKEPPLAMFPMQALKPNILVLYLQPDEGVHLRYEAKAPDTVAETRSVDMEFHYAEAFGPTSIPEAYERLLLDAIQGDASLFTRADEVEAAWGLIDPILQAWETYQTPLLSAYKPASWGPPESYDLMARDGRRWLNEGEDKI